MMIEKASNYTMNALNKSSELWHSSSIGAFLYKNFSDHGLADLSKIDSKINFTEIQALWTEPGSTLSSTKMTTKWKTQQIFGLKNTPALCDRIFRRLFTITWEVLSLAMLNSSYSIYKIEVCSTNCWEKVGADIYENCNQKCQEGVSSKTHYQGRD